MCEDENVPSGKRVTPSFLDSFSGYAPRNGGGGASSCFPGGAGATGGIVVLGFGEVNAYTRAAATLSAKVLNSIVPNISLHSSSLVYGIDIPATGVT
jgi:hypothetical protein